MNGFEEQARSAAADAHESVTRLAVPELGGRAAWSGRRLVLASAAVIALLVAGVLLLRGDDSSNLDVVAEPDQPATDDDDSVTAGDDSIYFTFDFDPELTVFARGSEPPQDLPETRIDMFGVVREGDPIGGGFLVVAASLDEQFGGIDDEPVEIRGTTGAATDVTATAQGIEWAEPSGVSIQLASDVLTIDQLVALGETLEIDRLQITVPSVPLDMQVVTQGLTSEELVATTNGWVLSVTDADRSGGTSLTGVRGSFEALQVLRAVYGAMEPVEIRGTTGYRFRDDVDVLVWRESGVLLTLSTQGDRDILAVAETVRPISPAAWQQLVDRSADSLAEDPTAVGSPIQGDSGTVIDSGTFDINGSEHSWYLLLESESVCISVSRPPGEGAGDCVPLGKGPSWAALATDPEQLGFIVGVAPEIVRTAVVRTLTQELQLPVTSLGNGQIAFGTGILKGEDVIDVVFLDKDGAPVDVTPTAEVDWAALTGDVRAEQVRARGTVSDVAWILFAGTTDNNGTDVGTTCLRGHDPNADATLTQCSSSRTVFTLDLQNSRTLVGGIAPECADSITMITQAGDTTRLTEAGAFAFVTTETPNALQAAGSSVIDLVLDGASNWSAPDACGIDP